MMKNRAASGDGWSSGGESSLRPAAGRSRRVRLVIVDDHPVFLEGLARVLARQPDFEIVELAENGEQAVRAWNQHRPDVLVLDLLMPGLGGLDTLRLLHGIVPDGRVLILTSSDNPADAAAAVSAGASGYVTKAARYGDIVNAIRDVHAGGQPIVGIVKQPASSLVPLTPREREVLTLLAEGLTYAAIGRRLEITQRTSRAHVVAIQQKLGAANNAQAVAHAYQEGLLRMGSAAAAGVRTGPPRRE